MAKILIADDEEKVRELLESILAEEGHDLEFAKNGEEVLDKFDQEIDIVVTDILMPEKEGMEVIRKLKEKNKQVKTIAISGGGQIGPDRYLDLAEKLGADDKIKKPFGPDKLIQSINNLLEIGG